MFFLLYSHNVIVSGKDKAAIYDLQHARIMYIPNAFVTVLEKLQTKDIGTLKKEHFQKNPDILDQYLEKLIENKMGRYISSLENFPKLDFSYSFPGTIYSAVLETDMKAYDPVSVVNDLDKLGCRQLEMRIKANFQDLTALKKMLSVLEENVIQSLNIFWEFNNSISDRQWIEIYNEFQKINSITIYNSPENKSIWPEVICKKESLNELERKGLGNNKLILDMKYYCESLKYNTTYNNKAAIDYKGNIKNVIYDQNDHGNVKDDNLIDVANSESFQKFWQISVDQIEELKDSPLRYVMYNPFPIYEKENKYHVDYLNLTTKF